MLVYRGWLFFYVSVCNAIAAPMRVFVLSHNMIDHKSFNVRYISWPGQPNNVIKPSVFLSLDTSSAVVPPRSDKVREVLAWVGYRLEWLPFYFRVNEVCGNRTSMRVYLTYISIHTTIMVTRIASALRTFISRDKASNVITHSSYNPEGVE